jgi:beta-lactamase class A
VKAKTKREWGIAALVILALLTLAAIVMVMLNRTAPQESVGGRSDPSQILTDTPTQSPPQTAPPPPLTPKAPPVLAQQISALAQSFNGNVGVAIVSVDQGWIAGHDTTRIFPQQSVSKLWVAMAVLDKVDKGEIKLTDRMPLTAKDLTIFHQPVRKYILAGNYDPSISELMLYAVAQSDNTANDALYRLAGGQQAIGGFIARKTLGQIAIGPGEKILQTEMAGLKWDPSFSYGRIFWQVRSRVPAETRTKALANYLANPADGATPEAIAKSLSRLKRGELLSPGSTAFLLDMMAQSKTGPDRLRGGLSKGWIMPHKTGTGQVLGSFATAYNDVGILTAPNGRSYILVVMIGSTHQPVQARQELMQAITRTVIAHEGK